MTRLVGLALCMALVCGPAYAGFGGLALQPCDNQPPAAARHLVTVPVSIFAVPGAAMFAVCHKQITSTVIYGCTFQASSGKPALVLLNADEDGRERACTLAYEEAHLPPNNWLDPVMERRTPDATLQPVSTMLPRKP